MRFMRLKGPDGTGADGKPPIHIRLEGLRKQALETGRNRLVVTGVIFALAFAVIGGRLVELALLTPTGQPVQARIAEPAEVVKSRADIVDRNGVLLATSLPVASLYANPHHILDAAEAARRLAGVLPGLDARAIRAKLEQRHGFVWLKRNLTPKQQFAVNALGIPGVYFRNSERRLYPQGPMVSHVLGLTNVDGQGLAGVEAYFDRRLTSGSGPLELSLDIRVQALMRRELGRAMTEFRAIGAAGLVLDVLSGEVLAMVSLPDFDPNLPASMSSTNGFNRVTKGVYEMGSTFKLFTAAMALDSGRIRLGDKFDARQPIKISRFTISDYHGKNRWLTVPEIIVYSSNIGAAKMAANIGTKIQKQYLKRFGLLDPAQIELPEVGLPLTPRRWREVNTLTISYGHGIAISPMQVATGVAALVNGGTLHPPTLQRQRRMSRSPGERVLKAATSAKIRRLMRLVVRQGTGGNADVPGYRVGGKTGTADKPQGRGYDKGKLISSFVGTFPMNAPRYVVFALLDEPKGTKRSRGYATGGWVAAPVVGRVVRHMAPILGLGPDYSSEGTLRPGDPLFRTTRTEVAQVGAKPGIQRPGIQRPGIQGPGIQRPGVQRRGRAGAAR